MNGTEQILEKIIVRRNQKIESSILGTITKIAEDNGILTTVTLNERAIVHALQNASPEKPVILWDSLDKSHSCPVCLHHVTSCDLYCNQCGKKLDWSDEE